jgi:hypothetical protein
MWIRRLTNGCGWRSSLIRPIGGVSNTYSPWSLVKLASCTLGVILSGWPELILACETP